MKGTVSVGVIFISGYIANLAHSTILKGLVVDPVVENVVHLQASNPPTGVDGKWRMKTIWTPRWIKQWKTAKVIKPVWKKVWTPYEIREWVPIPKPPPGWDDSTPLLPIEEEIPPWNPIPPYPSDGPGPGPGPETGPTCGDNGDCNPGYEYNKPEATTAPPAVDSSADSNQLPRYPPHPEEVNLDMPFPSEFLMPPKFSPNLREKETVHNETETSPVYRTISKEEYERPYQKEVSPYAVKLAQAVIQEKLNKLKSVGEKQTGLTEVVYKNGTSQISTTLRPSTTIRSSTQKTVKLSSTTTTESSPKIFIVTPTTIKS